MMKDLVDLIIGLKDLSWKKTLLLGFIALFSIAIMKAEVFIDMWSKYSSKHSEEIRSRGINTSKFAEFLITPDTQLDMTNAELEEIQKYTDQYYKDLPSSVVSLSIYKFLPEGDHYSYQARVLVYFKSNKIEDAEKFIKETRIKFIPIWSGKFNIEKLLQGEPVLSIFDKESKEFARKETRTSGFTVTDMIDSTPSSNLAVLTEYGIQTIYRYPVKHHDRVLGYISVYASQLSKDDLKKLEEVTEKFSTRIAIYLQGDS